MPDDLALVGVHRSPTVGFLLLQHFRYVLLSSSRRCFISVFVRVLCFRRRCTNKLETLNSDRTTVLCIPRQNWRGGGVGGGLKSIYPPPPPNKFFTNRSKAALLLWFTISVIVCLCIYVLVIYVFGQPFG